MPTDPTNHARAEDTEQLRERLDAAVQELNDYRTRVRGRAIKGFRDGDWTLEKLNSSLEHLGLERFEPTYVHTTRATLDFPLRVAENDYDDAHATLRQLDTAAVRQAIQDAISSVLNENTTTVTIPDGDLTVSVGYPQQTMLD